MSSSLKKGFFLSQTLRIIEWHGTVNEGAFSQSQIKLLAAFNIKYQLSFNISEMIKSVHINIFQIQYVSPANRKPIQEILKSLSLEA